MTVPVLDSNVKKLSTKFEVVEAETAWVVTISYNSPFG